MDDQQFLAINDSFNIDVLDENLYCYENAVFILTPAIQKRASDNLIRKIERFIDSAPVVPKSIDNIQNKTEYIPRFDLLSQEIKTLLEQGKVELLPCKNSSGAFYLQIRSTIKGLIVRGKEYGKNKMISDVPFNKNTIPADIMGAAQCLSMQAQLNQIAGGLNEISEACEFNFGRIIQGQRDDRLARLLSGRSCFIQALAISDESLRHQMLLQTVQDANSARAELAFQIRYDINLLGSKKSPKGKDMEKIVSDINAAIIAMNNAVQLSLYSYQTLGEYTAQLAVVKEYETFIKQVLLKEIDYSDNKYLAWNLICSSGNSESVPQDFYSIPEKLIDSCTAFINDKNKKPIISMRGESDEKR